MSDVVDEIASRAMGHGNAPITYGPGHIDPDVADAARRLLAALSGMSAERAEAALFVAGQAVKVLATLPPQPSVA